MDGDSGELFSVTAWLLRSVYDTKPVEIIVLSAKPASLLAQLVASSWWVDSAKFPTGSPRLRRT